jgi:PDZ domain-containing secreted protein
MAKETLKEEKETNQEAEVQKQNPSTKEETKTVDQEYKIRNRKRAGQIVFGVTGKPVQFDSEGVAIVSKTEYDHFKKLPAYSVVS